MVVVTPRTYMCAKIHKNIYNQKHQFPGYDNLNTFTYLCISAQKTSFNFGQNGAAEGG